MTVYKEFELRCDGGGCPYSCEPAIRKQVTAV